MSNTQNNEGLDASIGAALRTIREEQSLTARQLSEESGVSAAMVSRIENGQVSASLSTLSALSDALDIPVVSLFRETASARVDIALVKDGEGIKSTRMLGEHIHHYLNLGYHRRRDMHFDAHKVTLTRQQGKLPVYNGHGIVFMHVLSGSARFSYGTQLMVLSEGDSLTFDAELSHGCEEIITAEFIFLSVQAESL